MIEPVSSDLSHKIDDSHVVACTNDVTSESNFKDEAEDAQVTDTVLPLPCNDFQLDQSSEVGTHTVLTNDVLRTDDEPEH